MGLRSANNLSCWAKALTVNGTFTALLWVRLC